MKVVVAGTAMNVLDDWLPIVRELRSIVPELEVEIFIPFRWILNADPTHDLDRVADELVDRLIVEEGSGRAISFETVRGARLGSKRGRLHRKLQRLTSANVPIQSPNWQQERTLLFDWTHWSADGTLGSWFVQNNFRKCFAINHGPVPNFLLSNHGPQLTNFSADVWKKTHFLGTASVNWRAATEKTVVGIPRHSTSWMKYLQTIASPLPPDSVVYISRAEDSNSPPFMPPGTRAPVLKWLFSACRERDVHLVVKRHPHEFAHEISGILPRRELDHTWSLASDSTVAIAQLARAVAVTHSMVSLDVVAAGKAPVSLRALSWALAGAGNPAEQTWLESVGLVRNTRSTQEAVEELWGPTEESSSSSLRDRYRELVGPHDGDPARMAAERIALLVAG